MINRNRRLVFCTTPPIFKHSKSKTSSTFQITNLPGQSVSKKTWTYLISLPSIPLEYFLLCNINSQQNELYLRTRVIEAESQRPHARYVYHTLGASLALPQSFLSVDYVSEHLLWLETTLSCTSMSCSGGRQYKALYLRRDILQQVQVKAEAMI